MLAEIRAEAERIAGDLAAIRRHLHQNPELSYKEVNTSAYLSRLLSEWGIKHRIGVGGHGIVADLGPAGKSPKVAFRADMDALPIQEQVQIPFCSTVPGVAHLCGHDAHVAMALGAVRILQNRIGAEGEAIRLLLQPAEELPPGGAEAMIRDGALAGIDSVVALHVQTCLWDNLDCEAAQLLHRWTVFRHRLKAGDVMEPILTLAWIPLLLRRASSKPSKPWSAEPKTRGNRRCSRSAAWRRANSIIFSRTR